MLWLHEHFNATKGLLHPVQRPLMEAWLPLIMALGIPGNILVIVTVPTLKFRVSGFPTFAVGLAVTDLLLLFLQTTPLWVEARFQYGLDEENDALCKILQWFRLSLSMLSVWTIVTMVAHRTWGVVRPTHAYVHNRKKQARMLLLSLTILTFAINSHALDVFRIRPNGSCDWRGEKNASIGSAVYFLAVVNSWLPLLIILASNYILVSALKNSAKVLSAQSPLSAPRPLQGGKWESGHCQMCPGGPGVPPAAPGRTLQCRGCVPPGGCLGFRWFRTKLSRSDADIRPLTKQFEQIKNEMKHLGVGDACETCYFAALQKQLVSRSGPLTSRSFSTARTSNGPRIFGSTSARPSTLEDRPEVEKIAASAEPRISWNMELRDETEFSESAEPNGSNESQAFQAVSSVRRRTNWWEKPQTFTETQNVQETSHVCRSGTHEIEVSGVRAPGSQQRSSSEHHSKTGKDSDDMKSPSPSRPLSSGRLTTKRWKSGSAKVNSVGALAEPIHTEHKKLYHGIFNTQRVQAKTTMTLIALSLAFIFLTLPWSIMEVMYFHVDHKDIELLFWHTVARLLFETSYAVNFYLYTLTARPIREKVVGMFSRYCREK